MTNYDRVFKGVDDRWWFWEDSWENTQGPFDEFNQAHAALTRYLEQNAKTKSKCWQPPEDYETLIRN
jgi:phage-related protein